MRAVWILLILASAVTLNITLNHKGTELYGLVPELIENILAGVLVTTAVGAVTAYISKEKRG